MDQHFRSTGRRILTDQAVAYDLKDADLHNCQFQRLVAVNKRFTKCTFRYSEFDSAYLRNCMFDSCDFTGCTFRDANLRGTQFNGCNFEYTRFSNTLVDPAILDVGCPVQENLQQKFARTLRTNFDQVGDARSANKAIMVELESNRIHLYKAWRSREPYYRNKYHGIRRSRAFLEWAEFMALDFFWGNGESALKLARSLAIVLVMIALGDVYFLRTPNDLSSYYSALVQAPEVFLGVATPKQFSGLALAGIASLRYLMIACLVSILIKRLSRR